MAQPKFVYDNMKDWVQAKEIAKRRMEDPDISPWMKEELTRYYEKLDDWKPEYLKEKAKWDDVS